MDQIIKQVRKRDGSLDKFDINRIASAIKKAAESVKIDNIELVKEISIKVFEKLKSLDDVLPVEGIQDIVEKVLIDEGHSEIAKAFIIYRQKRAELREVKKNAIGQIEKLKLSETSLLIVKEKYLLRDNNGNVIETPEEMFLRVSKYIAEVEKKYNKDDNYIKNLEGQFFNLISSMKFVPAGRILANTSTKNKLLHSSFVLPVIDDIGEIFKTISMQITLQKFGAGVGFSFSKLRPKNSLAKTSHSYAAGPVSFIEVFNAASNVIKQVSSRKAANMASLSVHHPDILEFIMAKGNKNALKNFNISVEVTSNFIEAAINNKEYSLVNPINNEIISKLNAKDVLNTIVTMAWKTGEPGILFIDEINKNNPLSKLGKLETTDPCGDQPLLPYDGTVYGAINLSKFIKNNDVDWDNLKNAIFLGVRFLDNCIDVSETEYDIINKSIKSNRKISLGIMGFADMLYTLSIPYNSDDAIIFAEKISEFLYSNAFEASKNIAIEKGPFPNFNKSSFIEKIRNSSLLAISPTGSRSILAETSPGIEPNFALIYKRRILSGNDIIFINKIFEETARKNKFFSDNLIREILKTGSITEVDEIPKKIKDIFVTAHEIDPIWHLKIQAAFQQKIDNAVSKTINFPKDCTINDIKKAITLAYNLEVKGLTVYRDSSRDDQIINPKK